MPVAPDRPVADSPAQSWVERAPARVRPYLRLARYDRPIGIWLLAGPAWLGMALANIDGVWRPIDLVYALLLGVGSIAMRGAGCTFNDIVDKDLDAKVARTASRPLPAGTVTLKSAWIFLLAQCLVGLAVLLALQRAAQIMALLSIPIVAAYPFMKRITWFPQAWLGIALNWGFPVGFAAAGGDLGHPAMWIVFLGLAAWTFGYDTIYAHQDKEDDALIGVKSTARFFGAQSMTAIRIAYLLAAGLMLIGAFMAAAAWGEPPGGAAIGAVVAAGAFGSHLRRQASRVDLDDAASCLAWFKSNRDAILIAATTLAIGPWLLRLLSEV